MERRHFLTALGAPLLRNFQIAAAQSAPPVKITKIETFWWSSRDDAPFWPHWTWVRIHTDSGHWGLGETYPYGETEASLIHTQAARFLLGKDPRNIERIWADLYHDFDFASWAGPKSA